MELVFVGADHEVTGSCHYLQVGKKHLLVDCGMEQGHDLYENIDLPVPPARIDYVLLTHAHIDHSGMLPKLYHDGFRGGIIATGATASLCDIMLRDSAHIQEQEAEYRNRKTERKTDSAKAEPLYTLQDAIETIRLFRPYRYGEIHTLCEGVRFRFTDIGHLLGSASIELWLSEGGQEKKIVFSGDIGNKAQPLLRDPAPTREADYVVMESTYGDRLHEIDTGDPVAELAEIIGQTLRRGGNLVIPAFAVGRTQVMLYYIRQIRERGLLKDLGDFPVYVDSPLAVEASEIFYETDPSYYDETTLSLMHDGLLPLDFPGLQLSITTDESKAINSDPEPKVIISASGMCDAGRVRHHLKYNLWRPESTVLFVGYQSAGSPGRKILDGAKEIRLIGEDIAIRAQICTMKGMSGHADREGLLVWARGFTEKPKQVFVVHGEGEVTDHFAETLEQELGLRADAPYSGTRYDLASGKYIERTKGIPIEHAAAARSVSDTFTALRLAGRQLQNLIEASEGLPNKEKERFTKELKALVDKYRR